MQIAPRCGRRVLHRLGRAPDGRRVTPTGRTAARGHELSQLVAGRLAGADPHDLTLLQLGASSLGHREAVRMPASHEALRSADRYRSASRLLESSDSSRTRRWLIPALQSPSRTNPTHLRSAARAGCSPVRRPADRRAADCAASVVNLRQTAVADSRRPARPAIVGPRLARGRRSRRDHSRTRRRSTRCAAIALLDDPELDALVKKHWGKLDAGTPEEKLAEVRRLNNDVRAFPATTRPTASCCSRSTARRAISCSAKDRKSAPT